MKAVSQLFCVSFGCCGLDWTGWDWWGGERVQVREYDVDYEDESAQCAWEEGGDECREEEDDGEDGLDFKVSFVLLPRLDMDWKAGEAGTYNDLLVDNMLSMGTLANKV
jgi:hypothetical protein